MEYIPTAGNLLSIFKDNGKVIEDEMLCGCQCTSYQLKNTEISTTFDIQEYFNEYHERVLLNSATVCIAFPEGENYSLCMDTEFVGGETNTKLSIKEMNFPCKTLGYDPDTGLLKIGPLWFDTNLKKMVKDLRFLIQNS